jgi:RNA polymerase sigma factor (sigma-70 family)
MTDAPRPSEQSTTVWLQVLVGRVRGGDQEALNCLFAHVERRLHALTRRLLQNYPGVRHWEQTDDVVQQALIRLLRALQTVDVVDVSHLLRLAAKQVRYALLTLAEQYRDAPRFGAFAESTSSDGNPLAAIAQSTSSSRDLDDWTAFHVQAEQLPDHLRQVFDLVYYHGMTQEEAGEVLGLSDRTVRKRWRDARKKLSELLGGRLPGS